MRKKLLIIGVLFTMIILLSGCSSAGGYYRSGKKNFVSGNYEAAADYFTKAITKNPNRADYYIDYGMALISLERYDEAIEQFDRVYMDKDVLMVRENNKRALRGKGIVAYCMQSYQEAISQFDAALAINALSDLDVDILYYKGNALIKTGAYEEARDSYTRIIERNNKEAEALSMRAYTYLKAGEFDKSLADYEEAIRLKPNHYEYHFGKYELMLEKKDEAGAAAVLSQAAAIEAVSKEDRYHQARIRYYQGDYETALAELSEGFAQGFPEAHFYIGEIYAKQKDYATAIYYYEKYIEKDDVTESSVYNQVAYCYMKQGDHSKALRFLEKGISMGDAVTMKALKRNEIIALEYLGQFDTAQEKLSSYLSAYPEDQEAAREVKFLNSRRIDHSNRAEEEDSGA